MRYLLGLTLLGLIAAPSILLAQGTEPYSRTGDLFLIDDPVGFTKIWRLADLNLDGDFLDPGESICFFDQAAAPLLSGIPRRLAVASNATASIAVPPFGILGLDLAPTAMPQQVLQGLIPPNGRFQLAVPPVAPAIAPGFLLHLQALTGPSLRLELSNPITVSFGP